LLSTLVFFLSELVFLLSDATGRGLLRLGFEVVDEVDDFSFGRDVKKAPRTSSCS
jgi:hypothetical protein